MVEMMKVTVSDFEFGKVLGQGAYGKVMLSGRPGLGITLK